MGETMLLIGLCFVLWIGLVFAEGILTAVFEGIEKFTLQPLWDYAFKSSENTHVSMGQVVIRTCFCSAIVVIALLILFAIWAALTMK